jgi:ion channel
VKSAPRFKFLRKPVREDELLEAVDLAASAKPWTRRCASRPYASRTTWASRPERPGSCRTAPPACTAVRMSPRRESVARFWLSDWSLSVLQALLVVDIFILGPVIQFRETPGALQPVVYSLFVVAATPIALTSRWRRCVSVLLGTLGVVSIVIRWTSCIHTNVMLACADTLASLAFCVVLTAVVLAQAYAPGPIDLRRIQGAVAAYLLLAYGWALAYRLVALGDPVAFSFAARDMPLQTLTARLLYFSMTTLTTVGYGDITPINPVARSLANLEGFIGQLFPALTLARLVSMQMSHRQQRDA